jgi:uncharacterized protein
LTEISGLAALQSPENDKDRIAWLRIALFYLAALAITFAAAQMPATSRISGYTVDGGLLIGLGPLIATLLTCALFRQQLPSLFGDKRTIGIAALAAPVVATAILGFPKLAEPGLAGVIFGASIIVYCLCEEAGWRGFLTGALAKLKNWHADLLSAALWFAWHFTFMPELYDPDYVIGFTAAIFAGAFGLAETRRRTGGFALAAGWHAAVKLAVLGSYAIPLFVILAILTWRSKPDRAVS